MIKNEREYREMQNRLEQDLEFINKQLHSLRELALSEEDVQLAMQPAYSFHEQLKDEVEYYERIKRKDFDAIMNFYGVGRLLIALRIAQGMTQRELAAKLGVSEAQVSRDERNEYHGLTIDRASKVLNELGVTIISKVEGFGHRRELELAH